MFSNDGQKDPKVGFKGEMIDVGIHRTHVAFEQFPVWFKKDIYDFIRKEGKESLSTRNQAKGMTNSLLLKLFCFFWIVIGLRLIVIPFVFLFLYLKNGYAPSIV